MKFKKTKRGFDIAEFTDSYGQSCSIQKSSIDTEDCIWLGVELNRMHLTRKQVAKIIIILQNFVYTGQLKNKLW